MGRAPCCDKAKVKRGAWSPEEDAALTSYLHAHHGSPGNWISLPHKAGLKRCGKSCRLRWLNYLRPHIKRGGFTEEEDNIILSFYSKMGSRWSVIAANLPGRTDNDVKNHWNTKLKKKLFAKGEENPKKTLANNEANCNTTTIQFTSNGNPNNSLLNDHLQHLYLPSFASLLAQGNSIYESSSSLGHPSTLPIDQLMLASSLNYPHREHLGPILVHDQISQSQEAHLSTISESTSLVDQPQYCLSNPFYSSNEEDVLVFGDAALGFGSTFINNPYDNELLVVEEAGFGH